jgi:hypothetical protein
MYNIKEMVFCPLYLPPTTHLLFAWLTSYPEDRGKQEGVFLRNVDELASSDDLVLK